MLDRVNHGSSPFLILFGLFFLLDFLHDMLKLICTSIDALVRIMLISTNGRAVESVDDRIEGLKKHFLAHDLILSYSTATLEI